MWSRHKMGCQDRPLSGCPFSSTRGSGFSAIFGGESRGWEILLESAYTMALTCHTYRRTKFNVACKMMSCATKRPSAKTFQCVEPNSKMESQKKLTCSTPTPIDCAIATHRQTERNFSRIDSRWNPSGRTSRASTTRKGPLCGVLRARGGAGENMIFVRG